MGRTKVCPDVPTDTPAMPPWGIAIMAVLLN